MPDHHPQTEPLSSLLRHAIAGTDHATVRAWLAALLQHGETATGVATKPAPPEVKRKGSNVIGTDGI
jgi:hypothetical protein